jgi:hypothetical protein
MVIFGSQNFSLPLQNFTYKFTTLILVHLYLDIFHLDFVFLAFFDSPFVAA